MNDCWVSYINKCHDPESVLHNGLLFLPSIMWQVALSCVVLHNRTVSQHAPEMMHDLGLIPRMIPTACFGEERICNQWAHQGTEPNEEVQSLQEYIRTMYSQNAAVF